MGAAFKYFEFCRANLSKGSPVPIGSKVSPLVRDILFIATSTFHSLTSLYKAVVLGLRIL